MKTSSEKEKKLNLALSKLKNLNHENTSLTNTLQNLDDQKNQLEIEKKEILNRYEDLIQEHKKIKQELTNYKNKKNNEQSKVSQFSENSISFFCSLFFLLLISSNFCLSCSYS